MIQYVIYVYITYIYIYMYYRGIVCLKMINTQETRKHKTCLVVF